MKTSKGTLPDGDGKPQISARRLEANRRNARRSTGPRTPDGKARVSGNAVTHGLLAKHAVVLPMESAEEYTTFAESLRAELKPVGLLEGERVDQIIACLWRQRRLGRMEAGILTAGYFTILADEARGVNHAYDQVARSRDRAEVESAMIGRVYVKGQFARSNLLRYETTVGRSLQRAVDELERLQRARQGDHIRTPRASQETSERASPDVTTEETDDPLDAIIAEWPHLGEQESA